MKRVFAIACAGFLFASCTKDSPLTASLDKIHGDFKFVENYKQPNITSSLRKNDSTTIGGWRFDDTPFQPVSTTPSTQYFTFYTTPNPSDDDTHTGNMVFTVDLSGIHLTDSVMDHEIVYYYIYTGKGKWRYNSSNGTLKDYFKITASGELTYKSIIYTKDEDGIPYDNAEYSAVLDGFGR